MTDAKMRLEELGAVLKEAGLRIRLAVSDPPLLHVENPEQPTLREQIGCSVNPIDGELWFQWAALDVLLGKAADVPSAAERVQYVLQRSSSLALCCRCEEGLIW
jgi:hypothetical protein